ncbi:hypothetical protein Lalb_Chr23g0277401 [Lupinus albus]|uniref:Uncharacterized protein n=1 Tax=Lupinus albus TaxID=3870 RepID=A0A6A4N679_LUPAL|nr:hypothetical protein Lalb_Chr23g0277401 [Lupinus albus]
MEIYKLRVDSMQKEVKMLNKWDEYGCKNCHDYHPWLSKEDYDIFALGASLEAF